MMSLMFGPVWCQKGPMCRFFGFSDMSRFKVVVDGAGLFVLRFSL